MSYADTLFDLTGQTILITGGSRGLGREMAFGVARCGADVVIASRKMENCIAVAEQIESETGSAAMPYQGHVGRWDELDGLVESAPNFQASSFNGNVSISGSFTSGQASALANELKYGSLPVRFVPQSTLRLWTGSTAVRIAWVARVDSRESTSPSPVALSAAVKSAMSSSITRSIAPRSRAALVW